MKTSLSHFFTKSLWLLTILLIVLTTGAIAASQLSVRAGNCISRDFQPGFTAQDCNPDQNYVYEPVEADWENTAIAFGIGALIDLSILVSLWNIRHHFEDALFPKANDTRKLTEKEQRQRIAAVVKRHRNTASRLFLLVVICAVLVGGAWVAASIVTYDNNNFLLNDITRNILTAGIPLFLVGVSGGATYWGVGKEKGVQ